MRNEKQAGVYVIEVKTKRGLFDAFGHEVLRSIQEAGISGVDSVLVSQLYRIEGVAGPAARKMAREVLIDRVAQDFTLSSRVAPGSGIRVIEVWFRPGVTDTVADTAVRAAADAGIKGKLKISTGQRYVLEGTVSRAKAESIAGKLLANELIHEYTVT